MQRDFRGSIFPPTKCTKSVERSKGDYNEKTLKRKWGESCGVGSPVIKKKNKNKYLIPRALLAAEAQSQHVAAGAPPGEVGVPGSRSAC